MPAALRDEISNNFSLFEKQWPAELSASQASLATARNHFEQSYIRISTVQAWRVSVIVGLFDEDAEAFFFEAQNDLLISHCLARCGSFRQALKALRSAIENIYFALYYNDHPVELQKWNDGRYKIGFTDLQNYFESHPAVVGSGVELSGLGALKGEYATLSKAVHGSAKVFRMTRNLSDIRLWGDDVASVGKWASCEKTVIVSINLLLAHLFREKLLGAGNRNLRKVMGLIVPKKKHATLKTKLGVTLISM